VCPGDVYHSTIDGVTVRTSDGVHFPLSAWPVIDPALYPVLAKAGQEAPDNAPKS